MMTSGGRLLAVFTIGGLALAGSFAAEARGASVAEAPPQARGGAAGQERGRGRPEARGEGRSGAQGQARSRDQPRGRGQARAQDQARGPRQDGQGEGQARGQRQDGQGQARGRGEARGRGQAPGRARDQGPAAAPGRPSMQARGAPPSRGRADARARVAALPPGLRRMASSDRAHERMVLGAVAFGAARGLDPDVLRIRTEDDRVRVFNRDDDLLLDIDEDRARELGAWRLRRLGDRPPTAGAPAFCRSGEGHPVWGREWCLDKGFGVGSRPGTLWSRGSVDDVIFRSVEDRSLDADDLLDVLGDVVLGRLALHALSLGFDEPLVGVWVAEPEAPRILRVRAGDVAVAELVDADRDDRVETLYALSFR